MSAKKNSIPLIFLMIYFLTKLFWDNSIPYVFEILSIIILIYGFIMYFMNSYTNEKLLYLIIFGVMSIYIIINALCQDSMLQIRRSIYEYILYTSFIFSIAYYIKKTDFILLCKVISILGLIISLLSWYEWISKSYLIGSFSNVIAYGDYIGFRAAVFSRSFLSHGMVLGFFSIVSFYLFFAQKGIWYLFISLFNILSILTTSSRGPLVATGCAVFFMYILRIRMLDKNNNIRIISRWLIVFAICMMIFILLSDFTTGMPSIDYFLYRIRQIINWTGDAGNVGRLMIWSEYLEVFKSSPFFGIGPSKTGSWGSGSIGVTESGLLKHLCELGLVGFILYYSIFILIIYKGYKLYKEVSERDKLKLICFFGVIIMVFINNITLQSTEEIMVFIIYSFGLGGILSINYLSCEEENQKNTFKQVFFEYISTIRGLFDKSYLMTKHEK